MGIDGRLLAKARATLDERRDELRRQNDARRAEIYEKIPEIRDLEHQLRTLMPEVVSAALSKEDAARQINSIQKKSLDLQMRRAELLTEHGFPSDYLDKKSTCDKCGGSGYIMGAKCSCLMEQYERELTGALSDLFKLGDESFETFRLDFYSKNLDTETGASPRESMELVYGVCVDYAECFNRTSGNLLFQGGTGLGKTFLSACIARVVARKGFSVVYDTAVSALSVFESEKFNREEDASARAKRLTECDLLILDDLGTELSGSFAMSAIYTLINSRLIARKKTIITTNLGFDELRRRYTPQICSRLEGEYLNLNFYGRDIRVMKKESSF